jgi:hypothetical protein
VFKANHRAQPQALYAPAEHAPASIAAAPAPRRRALTLRAILEAFSWLGEMRAMPFVGLEPGLWYNERPGWDD